MSDPRTKDACRAVCENGKLACDCLSKERGTKPAADLATCHMTMMQLLNADAAKSSSTSLEAGA